MKALSITEPYATLIRNRLKNYETRSWKTNYRGDLIICASKTRIPKRWKENAELKKLVDFNDLHQGMAVCKCKLTDCIEMTPEFIEKLNPTEYAAGFYEVGRYAWKLECVEPIDPVPVKGRLGLWEVDLK